MDPVGPPIASSVAGTHAAERNASKEAKRSDQKPAARFRRLHELDEVAISPIEGSEALRDPKGNDQEESHEDRQEQGHYTAAEPRDDDHKPHIDIQG
ncbi:MAG: hypothetical protein EA376_14795 [Phycisphaeraceae bacterium]|nr:MAG: hypothetical protein EA376_14795 [Phycisphaeraceae bacterium]